MEDLCSVPSSCDSKVSCLWYLKSLGNVSRSSSENGPLPDVQDLLVIE